MDLTGQLSNLSPIAERLFALPLSGLSHRSRGDGRHQSPIFRQRRYEVIRAALVHELLTESAGLRLREIRLRVEDRLGEPVDRNRFRDYVNDQSRGSSPLLERLGWGVYHLAPK